ncbi:C6 transcription factor [Colletotrichum sojae]|uniref:C6 transcription factor n=1 Tax=Colletotrichum sojae TaxID=2175907 RepID=A0A8H6JDB2_9PEZI|nr:C6 transcription factor [Colletotrichum sojae]
MPATSSSLSKRACDSCRQRKVKCDAAQPCTFNVVPRKRGPKGPREGAQESQTAKQCAQDSPETAGEARSLASASITHLAYSLIDSYSSPSEIRRVLFASVADAVPMLSIKQIVDKCISLYVLHLFPSAPVCHIPGLQTMAAAQFPLDGYDGNDNAFEHGTDHDRVAHMRAFTLLTAVCAAIASVYPETMLPYRDLVAAPFLGASRSMLKVYEDYDTQVPISSSLPTRLLQSAALQHAAGKTSAAWHVLSQAGLLAQSLRLHSEQSLTKYDQLEATLLRNNFWMLFVADKSAIAMANRPVTLHEPLFDSTMDLAEKNPIRGSLLDPSMRNLPEAFEETLTEGFLLIRRCWASASRLLVAIRSKRQNTALDDPVNHANREDRESMTRMHKEVMGLLDELPPWLDSPDTVELEPGYDVAFQRSCFWTQKAQLIDFMRVTRSILLEISQKVESEDIRGRASSLLSSLLDILARLDSRASDELIQQSSQGLGSN